MTDVIYLIDQLTRRVTDREVVMAYSSPEAWLTDAPRARQDAEKARAALLDAFAAKDAEIARLKVERDLAQASAEDYDKDCIDMRYQRDAAQQYAASAEAENARLTALARVPEELVRLSETARRGQLVMSDGWDRAFAQAAADWVRSLIAAQSAPAPTRQGSEEPRPMLESEWPYAPGENPEEFNPDARHDR